MPGWTYYYRVLSVNAQGTESGLSQEVSAAVPQVGEGQVLWSFQTGGEVFSSPALGGDSTIYVASDDHHLYAIRPDGSLRWRFRLKEITA